MSFEETLEEIVRRVVREELLAVRDDKLLTAEQAAEHLGYADVHSIYRLKREKKIRAVRVGENSVRFKISELNRFIEERSA